MGIDLKYGRVAVEHPGPGDNEPVVVFRAQDELVPDLLRIYRLLCSLGGSPSHHLDVIDMNCKRIEEWQANHAGQIRIPNSNRWAQRVGR